MELDKKRSLIVRILIVLNVLLFGTVSALELFDHPIEVIILAVPLLTFQILILTWQSLKWIIIIGVISILVMIVEIFVNIFYFHEWF